MTELNDDDIHPHFKNSGNLNRSSVLISEFWGSCLPWVPPSLKIRTRIVVGRACASKLGKLGLYFPTLSMRRSDSQFIASCLGCEDEVSVWMLQFEALF